MSAKSTVSSRSCGSSRRGLCCRWTASSGVKNCSNCTRERVASASCCWRASPVPTTAASSCTTCASTGPRPFAVLVIAHVAHAVEDPEHLVARVQDRGRHHLVEDGAAGLHVLVPGAVGRVLPQQHRAQQTAAEGRVRDRGLAVLAQDLPVVALAQEHHPAIESDQVDHGARCLTEELLGPRRRALHGDHGLEPGEHPLGRQLTAQQHHRRGVRDLAHVHGALDGLEHRARGTSGGGQRVPSAPSTSVAARSLLLVAAQVHLGLAERDRERQRPFAVLGDAERLLADADGVGGAQVLEQHATRTDLGQAQVILRYIAVGDPAVGRDAGAGRATEDQGTGGMVELPGILARLPDDDRQHPVTSSEPAPDDGRSGLRLRAGSRSRPRSAKLRRVEITNEAGRGCAPIAV